jgi:hypothetical protein
MGIMIGALAAIPDASGVIHGCYAPNNGYKLRVIDTAKTVKCPSGKVALNWNQKGVPGSPGPQGIQGSPGPEGEPGGGGVFVRSSIDYVIPARTVPVNQGDIYLNLPGGSWVQQAGRLEQFAARAEVVSAPSSCTPEDPSESEGDGLVWFMRVIDANGVRVLPGFTEGSQRFRLSDVASPQYLSSDRFLWGEDGAERSFQLQLRNDCVGQGESWEIHVEIQGVAFS